MSDKPTPFNNGYQPIIEKGYQPVTPIFPPRGTDGAQGGYQPPSNEGGGPTNPPPNKK